MPPQRTSSTAKGLLPQRTKVYTSCDQCGYTTGRSADLTRHMKSHLSVEEKAALSLPCPFLGCEHQTLQESNLRTHIKTHYKFKDQKCPDCAFATTDPASLSRHRKRHHGYQPCPRKQARRNASNSSSASVMSTFPSRTGSAVGLLEPSLSVSSGVRSLPPLGPSFPSTHDLRSTVDRWSPQSGDVCSMFEQPPPPSYSSTEGDVTLPSFMESFGSASHCEVELASGYRNHDGPPNYRSATYPTTTARYKPYYHHWEGSDIHGEAYDCTTYSVDALAVPCNDVAPASSSLSYSHGRHDMNNGYYSGNDYPTYTYPPPSQPTFR